MDGQIFRPDTTSSAVYPFNKWTVIKWATQIFKFPSEKSKDIYLICSPMN